MPRTISHPILGYSNLGLQTAPVTKSVFTRRHEYFRKTLTQARKKAGLTQLALAKKLGRPQSFVSKFERGERRLDVIEFLDVAKALGIEPAPVLADLERR
jgi:ribosome-binding protein aMBF1 (putative translation factor)